MILFEERFTRPSRRKRVCKTKSTLFCLFIYKNFIGEIEYTVIKAILPDIRREPYNMKNKSSFRKILPYLLLAVCAATTVALTFVCVPRFRQGFIFEHAKVILSVAVCVELVYIALTLFFGARKSETVFKFMLTGIVLAAFLLLMLFIFQATGLMDKIGTVEKLRKLVESTGAWAPLIFIVIQFLQVVILPIPGTLTVGAGVLLFGPLKTSLYSLAGIFAASLVAFWIGRHLGYKAAAWIVGKEDLDKWLQKVKGKDRVVLSAMFLLPVFPDDILCFVAGLSTMSWRFFIVIQLIARTISVFVTSFSLNGNIIPYNTWWGILIWCLIGIAVIALFVLLYRKGEKIEKWFFDLFHKKKRKNAAAACEKQKRYSLAQNEKTETSADADIVAVSSETGAKAEAFTKAESEIETANNKKEVP